VAKPFVMASHLIPRVVAGKQAVPPLPSWFQAMVMPSYGTQAPRNTLGPRLLCCWAKQCPGSPGMDGQHTNPSLLPLVHKDLAGQVSGYGKRRVFPRLRLNRCVSLLLPRAAVRAEQPEPLTPHPWRRRIFFAPSELAECPIPHHKTTTEQYDWKEKVAALFTIQEGRAKHTPLHGIVLTPTSQ